MLMGDAVHPMMPNLGQGGCQAIEDAYELTRLLAASKTYAEDFDPKAGASKRGCVGGARLYSQPGGSTSMHS